MFGGKQFGAGIVQAVKGYVERKLGEQAGVLAALGARLAEIETKGIRYRGTFRKSDEYGRSDMVTHAGGMLHACRETREVSTPRVSVSGFWVMGFLSQRSLAHFDPRAFVA